MKHFTYALLGATLLAGPLLAQDKDLLIGSTSASSSHYGYFVAVGQLINENADGLRASVVETGATMDNIRRMERGQVDLGLVTTNVAQHAAAGKNDFEGKPQDLSLLWVYTGAPQNVVMRADAGVQDLAGLEGVRFNPGIKGSATEATTEAVFATLGLSADYVRGSTTDVVGMIKDNRVAGYVKSGSGNKLDGSTMDIATSTDIAILGLTPEQAETLRTEMPDISVVDIPEGAADGIPAYTTWSFGVGVAAPDFGLGDMLTLEKLLGLNVAWKARTALTHRNASSRLYPLSLRALSSSRSTRKSKLSLPNSGCESASLRGLRICV